MRAPRAEVQSPFVGLDVSRIETMANGRRSFGPPDGRGRPRRRGYGGVRREPITGC
jgi:hypothetical protein